MKPTIEPTSRPAPLLEKIAQSGRPIALQKFSQSHGSVQPIVRCFPSFVSYTA